MGCFSFLCKVTNKPANSTSFSGSPCHLFLLKDGKVIEHMYGNYDSYGRVFDGKGDSFEWKMDWNNVCDLMFNKDKGNGIAMILAENYFNEFPTKRSNDDPDQGWSSEGPFQTVKEPFHKVY